MVTETFRGCGGGEKITRVRAFMRQTRKKGKKQPVDVVVEEKTRASAEGGARMGKGTRESRANLLLPALARVAGLSSALALVVGDSGARHLE